MKEGLDLSLPISPKSTVCQSGDRKTDSYFTVFISRMNQNSIFCRKVTWGHDTFEFK